MSSDYSYVLLFLLIGIGFVIITMWIAWFLRPHNPGEEKLSTYECGERPIGQAHLQFNFRFYIFGLLFLVFDIEVVFLYPFAVKFKEFVNAGKGALVLIEIAIFIIILVIGLIYVWRKGLLKWE